MVQNDLKRFKNTDRMLSRRFFTTVFTFKPRITFTTTTGLMVYTDYLYYYKKGG